MNTYKNIQNISKQNLTDNSRLGCQIITAPEIDNIELIIPYGTRNTIIH